MRRGISGRRHPTRGMTGRTRQLLVFGRRATASKRIIPTTTTPHTHLTTPNQTTLPTTTCIFVLRDKRRNSQGVKGDIWANRDSTTALDRASYTDFILFCLCFVWFTIPMHLGAATTNRGRRSFTFIRISFFSVQFRQSLPASEADLKSSF